MLQVAKYLIPRMREWDRCDIHGLAIVNRQRNLPGLDREHEHVFQADVLSNAEQQGFGLLTTWDPFRLVRGFIIHRWYHDDIARLFVTSGRIRPVPAHYEFIGVDGYWPQASALGLRSAVGRAVTTQASRPGHPRPDVAGAGAKLRAVAVWQPSRSAVS